MSTDKDLRERFERWWSTQHVPDIATPDYIAFKAYKAAHAEAQAEIEALRKDAERYRWLRERMRMFQYEDKSVRHGRSQQYIPDDLPFGSEGKFWDERLDAAMASEVKP